MGDFPWIDTSLDVTWALLGLGAGATERAIDALAGAVRGAGGPNARQLAFQLVSLALHGVNGGPLQHESASLTERQRSALRAVLDIDAMWAGRTSDTSSRSFGLAPVTEYRGSGAPVQTGRPAATARRPLARLQAVGAPAQKGRTERRCAGGYDAAARPPRRVAPAPANLNAPLT
jgi:hypothetical protein